MCGMAGHSLLPGGRRVGERRSLLLHIHPEVNLTGFGV